MQTNGDSQAGVRPYPTGSSLGGLWTLAWLAMCVASGCAAGNQQLVMDIAQGKVQPPVARTLAGELDAPLAMVNSSVARPLKAGRLRWYEHATKTWREIQFGDSPETKRGAFVRGYCFINMSCEMLFLMTQVPLYLEERGEDPSSRFTLEIKDCYRPVPGQDGRFSLSLEGHPNLNFKLTGDETLIQLGASGAQSTAAGDTLVIPLGEAGAVSATYRPAGEQVFLQRLDFPKDLVLGVEDGEASYHVATIAAGSFLEFWDLSEPTPAGVTYGGLLLAASRHVVQLTGQVYKRF